jgi:branched-chain amino acid transport system substrate-binding protein
MNKLTIATCAIAWAGLTSPTFSQDKNYGPGVTDTEVKIGQTMPYSGPASSFAAIGRAMVADFE